MSGRLEKTISFLSAEWILDSRSNGGTAIVLRTVFISVVIYLIALLLKDVVDPQSQLKFSLPSLRQSFVDTLPWLGAIFAGVYAALYARFASQWQYLASLYNQQMEVSATHKLDDLHLPTWRGWEAALVEDACRLHLASKPEFAPAINMLLKNAEVRGIFMDSTIDAATRLERLRNEYSRLGLDPFPVDPVLPVTAAAIASNPGR